MKRTLLLIIFVFAISLARHWKGAPSALAGRQPREVALTTLPQSGQAYLPDLTADFSDLDARDAQNRPISRGNSPLALQKLFVENLFTLALVEPTHELVQALTLAEAISHLIREAFFDCSQVVQGPLVVAINSASRRFVHNVNNLWIQLSVGSFGVLLLSLRSSPQKHLLALPIRC